MVFLGEFLELPDEPAFAQAAMMLELLRLRTRKQRRCIERSESLSR
jgi:hypothetical protein